MKGAHGSNGAAPARKRVVVVGAGVAGMAAAHVLADAGFAVTVLEKAKVAGGRCLSYFDDELGHTVEHGIHGVFPRYANLRALFRDAGIDDAIYTRTKTTGVPGPGRTMHVTELSEAHGPAPFFLPAMVPPGVLRLRDYASSLGLLARTYAAHKIDPTVLDEDTFASLLRETGVSGRSARLLFVPYLKNLSYARGDEVSARTATEALAYYVLEGADDVKAQWIDGGMVPLIFEPWQRDLERRGVRFRLGTPARELLFDGPRLTGLATRATIRDDELGAAPRLFTQKVGASYLGLDWQPDQRRLTAFDGRCTHKGCLVGVDASGAAPVFKCPCHGGTFDRQGKVLGGPPERPLDPVALHHDAAAGVWVVGEDAGGDGDGDGVEPADYAVLALDIASLQAIFPRAFALDPSTAGIPLLRTTQVTVLRMRFAARPGEPKWSGPDSGVFAADDLLDNFFALHTMQREFAAMDDLFLECHIGDSEGFGALSDDDIYDRAVAVLDDYFPGEALGARLDRKRSRALRHTDAFSLFAPGDHALSPTVSDPHRPNVMFAGDWVRTDDPKNRCFFMERAAVTGIEAANAILRAEGRAPEQRPIARRAPPLASALLGLPVVAMNRVARALRRALGISAE